jgi:TPP-dependent pyruvate/acetoin dehydrogenase alpha subunit
VKQILAVIKAPLRDPRQEAANDPLTRARAALSADPVRLRELEEEIRRAVAAEVAAALEDGV